MTRLVVVGAGPAGLSLVLAAYGVGSAVGALLVSSMRLPIVGSVLATTGFSIVTVSFTLSLTQIGER